MTEQNQSLSEYIVANRRILIRKPFSNHPNNIKAGINVKQSTQNFMDCTDVLDEFEIKYVPLWGTLLGIYRDGCLIPHDTDVDIAVILEDESKLIKAIPSFEKKSLLPTRYWREVILSLTRGGDYIDLYLHRDAGGKRFQGPSFTLTEADFSGENTIEFNGKSFCTIQDPEAFFRKFYGSDWKTPIKDLHGSPANEKR